MWCNSKLSPHIEILGDIRDAINDIERCLSAGHDVFVADRMREDAVIRKLEIIGEAVKHLFDDRQRGRPAHNQVQGFQAITYESGGLEDDRVRRIVCDILDGGERAFREQARRLRVRYSARSRGARPFRLGRRCRLERASAS